VQCALGLEMLFNLLICLPNSAKTRLCCPVIELCSEARSVLVPLRPCDSSSLDAFLLVQKGYGRRKSDYVRLSERTNDPFGSPNLTNSIPAI